MKREELSFVWHIRVGTCPYMVGQGGSGFLVACDESVGRCGL